MKAGHDYFNNKSKFFSVQKDLALIINKLLQNDELCKMLYYTQSDCLKADYLTMQQKLNMVNNQIKIIPKLDIEEKCPIYIVVQMTGFTPNLNNPQFRDSVITISILVHPDHWNMGDFELRPYKIAGELDASLDNQKLTGIGELHFAAANNLVLNDSLMGLVVSYVAIHGTDDTLPPT